MGKGIVSSSSNSNKNHQEIDTKQNNNKTLTSVIVDFKKAKEEIGQDLANLKNSEKMIAILNATIVPIINNIYELQTLINEKEKDAKKKVRKTVNSISDNANQLKDDVKSLPDKAIKKIDTKIISIQLKLTTNIDKFLTIIDNFKRDVLIEAEKQDRQMQDFKRKINKKIKNLQADLTKFKDETIPKTINTVKVMPNEVKNSLVQRAAVTIRYSLEKSFIYNEEEKKKHQSESPNKNNSKSTNKSNNKADTLISR